MPWGMIVPCNGNTGRQSFTASAGGSNFTLKSYSLLGGQVRGVVG